MLASFTGTQSKIFELLTDLDSSHAHKDHCLLSRMYAGGHAYKDAVTPENYQASAHCFRELIEKLQRLGQTRAPSIDHSKITAILGLFDNFENQSDESLKDIALSSLLNKIREVRQWTKENLSDSTTSDSLDRLNGARIPEHTRSRLWGSWREIHKYFIAVSHHRSHIGDFNAQVDALDNLLAQLLRTSTTAETMIDIFRVIDEVENG